MKTKHRFYVATEATSVMIHNVASALLKKEFEELDELGFQKPKTYKIFIDTVKKTFYFTNDEYLESTNQILLEKYQASYYSTNLSDVKSWKP